MTLRKYLGRKNLWLGFALVLLPLLMPLLHAAGASWRLIGVLGVALIVAGLFVGSRISCPRCGDRIAAYIVMKPRAVQHAHGLEVGFDRCRQCGLHLDEEIEPRV